MAKEKETVHTPMGSGYGHGGAQPSGKVCTNVESTVRHVGLPPRDVGPGTIQEVIYDENANLPNRSE